MYEFPHPNLHGFECPVCKTAKDLPVVLVEISGTRRDSIAEAQQVHSDCYRLLCKMNDIPCDIQTRDTSPAQSPKEALRAACVQLVKDHESKRVGEIHNNHVRAARWAITATEFHPTLAELREVTKNLADDHEFGACGSARKTHLAEALAVLNDVPVPPAPPASRVQNETFVIPFSGR